MIKSIHSLIVDVQEVLKKQDWNIQATLQGRIHKPSLRLSKMGEQCPKALWHSIHTPELAEKLSAEAIFKFMYGDMIETAAMQLAKTAGHEVLGEQDEVEVDGIKGHRDGVIDGYIVDVKSAASKWFDRFRSGSFEDNFGYLDQLDGYLLGSASDPLVRYKKVAYDWVIDKQLGRMHLYEHHLDDNREAVLRARIKRYKYIVNLREPPACECGTITEANGNERLDLKASYSSHKHNCFPRLRTFIYDKGPVFMTRVVRRPFNKDGPIKEVDQNGNQVFS